MPSHTISTLSGIFLFASTIIGAGILALPVVASQAGFPPLAIMILGMAVVSALSGFYIAESVLTEQEHLPMLARKHLGVLGAAAMLLGLMIYIYGALVGYLAAGGQIFFILSGGAIPIWMGTLIYFAIGSVILHRGIVLASYVNTYLMYAMLGLLGTLIAMGTPTIETPLLLRSDWTSIFDVFGVVLFAYLGHSVIPSIAFDLRNKRRIGTVVSLGIALPCILYLLWSMVVLGVVPATSESGNSLAAARAAGAPATIPLGFVLGGSVIVLGNAFATLSTLTSYIGFGLSLKDTYGDLARRRQRSLPGIVLTGLAVVPPLVLALFNPGAFVHMLDIAGTFGGGLFVGILPALIVTKIRRAGASRLTARRGGALPYLVLAVYASGMLFTAAKLIGAMD